MAIVGEKVQAYCNNCVGDRRHTVLFCKERIWEEYGQEDDGPIGHERRQYMLAECDGCEHVTLKITDDASFYDGTYITQYPPQTIRKEPKWMVELLLQEIVTNPFKNEFMREIYVALRNNTLRLAVMGIRALLEQIMIEKIGDKGSFKKNLDSFQSDGYISKIQREAIDPVIEAGHASIHRGFKASKEEVIHLMDITENLIESIYINKHKSTQITVPKRSP